MLLRTSRTTTARTTRLAAAALTVALAGSACSAAGDEESGTPQVSGSAAASPSPAEPSATGSTGSAEPTPSETVPTAPDPSATTPPGTSLAAGDTAVVAMADSYEPGVELGTYGITVDSVTKQPLVKLPPDAPDPGSSDLYYVEQTWTLLATPPGKLDGGNLLQHTMVTAGGQPVQPVIVIDANPRGCDFASFSDVDPVGTARTSCTAFLVPAAQPVEAVSYIDYKGPYDYIDGNPVTWAVDAVG